MWVRVPWVNVALVPDAGPNFSVSITFFSTCLSVILQILGYRGCSLCDQRCWWSGDVSREELEAAGQPFVLTWTLCVIEKFESNGYRWYP